MDTKAQNDLRNKLCDLVLAALRDETPPDLARVIAAVHGTLAVVVGACPENQREEICEGLDGVLLDSANQYARRLRTGEFDEQASHSSS